MASVDVIKQISNFKVLRCDSLPSDHAPISLHADATSADLDSIGSRAQQLGDHAVLYGRHMQPALARPIRMS